GRALPANAAEGPPRAGARYRRALLLRSESPGVPAGELAEYGPGREPGAARIVVIEDPAHELAGGIESLDAVARLVLDLSALRIDLEAAEAEGDAAGDRIGFERRLVQAVRPVGLVDLEPLGAAAVLDRGVVGNVGAHRGVVFLELPQAVLGIHALELLHQLFQRVGGHLGDLADAVLVAQVRDDL